MMTEWVTLEEESIELGKGITARISVIHPEGKPETILIALGKLFKSVALKPEDWKRVLPVLQRKVNDVGEEQ
jgi:hypothetical protein